MEDEMREMRDRNKTLYYLDELTDYKVAREYEDIRGWEVVDPDNRTIGEVDDLLVNRNTEKVVYLDVEVDEAIAKHAGAAYDRPASEGTHSFMNEEGENHLIIPIGSVELDEENKKIYARDIEYSKFLQAKWMRKGDPINRDYEMNTLRTYYPNYASDEWDKDDDSFYDRGMFRHGTTF
jgi:sporulation protein YlmC with PRC-barrel domain